MTRKELLDTQPPDCYPRDVSDADLWRAVGAELRAIRERAGWRSTNAIARSGAAVDQNAHAAGVLASLDTVTYSRQ